MRALAPWLCIALVVGLSACDMAEEDPNALPLVHEDFPQIPQSGATQPFVVAPCYTISLPYDMEQVAVQGIDSNVARFDSESTRVLSDCGAYDVSYGTDPVAEQDVVIEGFDGVLSQYAGSFDPGGQVFANVVVLHLTKPGGLNGVTHLDVAVYFADTSGLGASLGILASVRDIWP